jgi:DNA-binding NtrC family response regulator
VTSARPDPTLETQAFCPGGTPAASASPHLLVIHGASSARFRQDLLFRLGAATVDLPPLRSRPREVPILARACLARARAAAGKPEARLSDATLARLAAYAFPGNVRELWNAMEYAVATMISDVVEGWDLPARLVGGASEASPYPAPMSSEPQPKQREPRRFAPIAEELRAIERRRMEWKRRSRLRDPCRRAPRNSSRCRSAPSCSR